ncbi:hypothetical protein MBRA1_000234 [Malassezia brasiliensis]|uniref:Phosphatidylglycerol/phosphatidylinositol transfer protein n=1 Tax=Malassezia brasiliensis TaxID=1821822 RepID=A0AAF0DPK3_9BASI|nr:hypothetical protein MBRA1_000234 [Malassezia brasiliensis]
MTDEAHAQGIPLDSELRPTSAEAQGGSFSWTQCGGDNFSVRVESIELSPEVPERGRNLTVHGKGTLSRRADFGSYVDVTVRVGFLRIFWQRVDICGVLRENDVEVQCPAEPGHYDVVHTVELPSQIPPAKYNIHIEGKNHEARPLACLDLTVSFPVFQRLGSWLRW